MLNTADLDPTEIRRERKERPGRARDVAHAMGLREAQLVAAHVGHGTVAIDANPDRLIPMIEGLGNALIYAHEHSIAAATTSS